MSNSFILTGTIEKSTGKPINILTWGQQKLSESDYARLVAAQARQDAMVDSAGAVFEDQYETVFSNILQKNVSVVIGTKVTFPADPPETDPEYESFDLMFSQDPDIIYHRYIQG